MRSPRGNPARIVAGVAVAVLIAGCEDRQSARRDSAVAADTAQTAREIDDSVRLDTTALYPASPQAPALETRDLPPVAGETRRQGGTIGPRDPPPPDDPPPLVAGETQKIGGTMAPSRPRNDNRRERDSTFGPSIMLGPDGKIVPIKR